MKRCAAMSMCGAMVVLAMLAVAGVAQADFLISLRSGTEIKVSRYQEEENQIAYRRFGGKITIPKKLVATVENLETGETRVFNRLLSAQELETQKKARQATMRQLQRKQDLRSVATSDWTIMWKSRADAQVGVRLRKKGESFRHLVACEVLNTDPLDIGEVHDDGDLFEVEVVRGPNTGCRGVVSLKELFTPR